MSEPASSPFRTAALANAADERQRRTRERACEPHHSEQQPANAADERQRGGHVSEPASSHSEQQPRERGRRSASEETRERAASSPFRTAAPPTRPTSATRGPVTSLRAHHQRSASGTGPTTTARRTRAPAPPSFLHDLTILVAAPTGVHSRTGASAALTARSASRVWHGDVRLLRGLTLTSTAAAGAHRHLRCRRTRRGTAGLDLPVPALAAAGRRPERAGARRRRAPLAPGRLTETITVTSWLDQPITGRPTVALARTWPRSR